MNTCRVACDRLDRTGLNGPNRARPIRTELDQSVPELTKVYRSGPKWTGVDRSGPEWTGMDPSFMTRAYTNKFGTSGVDSTNFLKSRYRGSNPSSFHNFIIIYIRYHIFVVIRASSFHTDSLILDERGLS